MPGSQQREIISQNSQMEFVIHNPAETSLYILNGICSALHIELYFSVVIFTSPFRTNLHILTPYSIKIKMTFEYPNHYKFGNIHVYMHSGIIRKTNEVTHLEEL
jgi:hypothetical protein